MVSFNPSVNIIICFSSGFDSMYISSPFSPITASLLKEDDSFSRLKMLMVLLHESNNFTVKFCWEGGRNALIASYTM